MGEYKVIQGQNIYDVALHIYGAIEGVTDLLVNNESVSFDSELKAGDLLLYTDDYKINKEVVVYYQMHGIIPASGEQHVFPKNPTLTQTMDVYTSSKEINAEFLISGNGKIEVDWGDNSEIQTIFLSDKANAVTHLFDSPIHAERKITMYIQAYIKLLDISNIRPVKLYIFRPIQIEHFSISNATLIIDALPMLRDVLTLTMNGLKTNDLSPLLELKNLKSLSILDTIYSQPTIDAYLIGLVRQHDNRRNCKITMTVNPSGVFAEPSKDSNNRYLISSGMEAIWVLTHEVAWNEGGAWEFIIKETIYKYEQNN